VFDDVLTQVARDPQWARLITEPPKALGVESVASTGIVLRGWIQTTPGKMFVVSRELNRRMSEAMSRADIRPGTAVSRVLSSESTAQAQEAQPARAPSETPPPL